MSGIPIRLAYAIFAGLVIGIFDLWIYQFSWTGFLAGVAAGITYALIVVFLFLPDVLRSQLILLLFAIVSGSLAGLAWWLVSRGSRLWVALAVGSTLALMHLYSERLRAGIRR
jgi:hypothetical protein